MKNIACSINEISIAELFELYEQANFLYPEKKKRIYPYLSLIRQNWEAALKADEDILWIITYQTPDAKHRASVTVWRTTQNGVFAQHLTSTGAGAGVGKIMLLAQAKVISKNYISAQNWFHPGNKFANKVFKTAIEHIGETSASLNLFHYLAVTPSLSKISSNAVKIVRCSNKQPYNIHELAIKTRGKVYAEGEELGNEDIELESVDEIYRKAGLSRKRFIWAAFIPSCSEPVGAAIAYRGPFGLNFSLLENRCDLLVDQSLNTSQRESLINALLWNAKEAYQDFPLNFMPVTADNNCAGILISSGSTHMRDYYQGIWLKDGFTAWYKHIEKIYEKINTH
jgi:hypothetical protein